MTTEQLCQHQMYVELVSLCAVLKLQGIQPPTKCTIIGSYWFKAYSRYVQLLWKAALNANFKLTKFIYLFFFFSCPAVVKFQYLKRSIGKEHSMAPFEIGWIQIILSHCFWSLKYENTLKYEIFNQKYKIYYLKEIKKKITQYFAK